MLYAMSDPHGPAKGRRGNVAHLLRALAGLATVKAAVMIRRTRSLGPRRPARSGFGAAFHTA